MIVGILKDPSFDNRVSMLAESAAALIKKGVTVWVEHNAGEKAFCFNKDYEDAGALIKTSEEVLAHADVILAINILPDELLVKKNQ